MKKHTFMALLFFVIIFALLPATQSNAKRKLKFSKRNVTIDIYKGTSTTLKVKKTGLTGSTYYTSSKPKVATVSSRGFVVARGKLGKTTITAYCGGLKAKCTVRVKSSKVTFDLPSYTFSVEKGDSSGINYDVKGSFSKPTWKSSNKNIATVDSIGRITGKSCGTTVITGKVGKKTRKLTVYVLEPGIVAKTYNDFLAQELVPAGPNDIPTEQKYITFSHVDIDQDGIKELAVFVREGGAGYSLYNNGTIYTYRNGGLLKYGNISHGIIGSVHWQLHISHFNVVISSIMYSDKDNYKELYYQLKNDKLYTICQKVKPIARGSAPEICMNAADQVISEKAYNTILEKLELGSTITNELYYDDPNTLRRFFGSN